MTYNIHDDVLFRRMSRLKQSVRRIWPEPGKPHMYCRDGQWVVTQTPPDRLWNTKKCNRNVAAAIKFLEDQYAKSNKWHLST